MRSLYFPLIIFWNAATGQLCEAPDFLPVVLGSARRDDEGACKLLRRMLGRRVTVSFLSVLASVFMISLS